jgi:DNA repair protein RadA
MWCFQRRHFHRKSNRGVRGVQIWQNQPVPYRLCNRPTPESKGGLGGAVLFIDTENTFSKEKIKRIAQRFGLNPDEVLANIYHARIYSSDHQLQMIQAAEAAVQQKGAKLIIVDSLMALLRSEYIGIGMLARRQQLLNKIIHDLSRIAETYNVAYWSLTRS